MAALTDGTVWLFVDAVWRFGGCRGYYGEHQTKQDGIHESAPLRFQFRSSGGERTAHFWVQPPKSFA